MLERSPLKGAVLVFNGTVISEERAQVIIHSFKISLEKENCSCEGPPGGFHIPYEEGVLLKWFGCIQG